MKSLSSIFLTSLLMVKVVLGLLVIYQVEFDGLSIGRNAIASEPQDNSKAPAMLAQSQDVSSEEADDKKVPRTAEEQIDLNFLLREKAEIEKEKVNLMRKKEQLTAIQKDITRKIEKLTQLRNEIRSQMAAKMTLQEGKLKHLIKAYSAMKPQKAASLIEKVDMKFAVDLLSHMKGDIVGNILSFMEIDKAAKISECLATRK